MVVLPFDGAVMGCFFDFNLESVAGCMHICVGLFVWICAELFGFVWNCMDY